MAISWQNTCAGLVNGTTVAAGASGGLSGDAFTAGVVVKGATSVLEGSTAHPITGGMGIHLLAAASEANYVGWTPAGEAQSSYASRCGLVMPTAGNASGFGQCFMQHRSASGTVANMLVTTANKMQMSNAAGGDTVTGTVTIPWVFTTKIWGELWSTKGTTTANGSAQARWYVGNTLQETLNSRLVSGTPTSTVGTYNTGIVDVTTVRFGRPTNPAAAFELWLGGFALQTAATGFIGLPSATALTVNGSVQVLAVIDYSSSVAGAGGEMTYSITRDSGPAVVPVEDGLGKWTVEQDPGAEIQYTVTISEAGNGFATAVAVVPKLATGTSSVGRVTKRKRVAGVWV